MTKELEIKKTCYKTGVENYNRIRLMGYMDEKKKHKRIFLVNEKR